MLERLPVDQTAERMRGLGNTRRQQAADLVQQALFELRVDPARDTLRRLLRRDPESERDDLVLRQRRRRRLEVIAERSAGQQVHLEGADQAVQGARLNAVSGLG